jgi:hypothetical protein
MAAIRGYSLEIEEASPLDFHFRIVTEIVAPVKSPWLDVAGFSSPPTLHVRPLDGQAAAGDEPRENSSSVWWRS